MWNNKLIFRLLYFLFAFVVFIFALVASFKLMNFVSFGALSLPVEKSHKTKDNSILQVLLHNTLLVALFVGQHSFFKIKNIEKLLPRREISPSLAKIVYVIFTCVSINILVAYWKLSTDLVLWSIPLDLAFCYWTFIVVHITMWAVTYGNWLMMDICDMTGIQEVYYYCVGIPASTKQRSAELTRLYSNQRHGSLTTLVVMLWLQQLMTLDRFLLAVAFTLYMLVAWKPTLDDLRYLEQQTNLKKHQIEYRRRRSARYFDTYISR